MSSHLSLFSVSGKNVLVTGGSRGIGLMIAKGFVQHGAKVVITSRDEQACQEASQRVGHGCSFVSSNISTRQGCQKLAKQISQVFQGKLDVLVNNAGCSWGEEAYERESGKMNWGWDKVLDLNVKGIFYLTRECVPLLRRDTLPRPSDPVTGDGLCHDPGRVINIGSIAGLVPQEAPTHAYDVSKAAVHQLTKKMASDLAPKNITVNAVAPGYVSTKMSKGLATWCDLDKVNASIPLRRMGNDDDMAGACIYLSSRAGAYCTGVILNVDGGAIGAMQIPLSSL